MKLEVQHPPSCEALKMRSGLKDLNHLGFYDTKTAPQNHAPESASPLLSAPTKNINKDHQCHQNKSSTLSRLSEFRSVLPNL
jgi:hypothetical protein